MIMLERSSRAIFLGSLGVLIVLLVSCILLTGNDLMLGKLGYCLILCAPVTFITGLSYAGLARNRLLFNLICYAPFILMFIPERFFSVMNDTASGAVTAATALMLVSMIFHWPASWLLNALELAGVGIFRYGLMFLWTTIVNLSLWELSDPRRRFR